MLLYLGDYERSKYYGERSFTEAVAVEDPIWQLNAKVLVAHSQTKLRQYREAEKSFEEALTLAKDQSKQIKIKWNLIDSFQKLFKSL